MSTRWCRCIQAHKYQAMNKTSRSHCRRPGIQGLTWKGKNISYTNTFVWFAFWFLHYLTAYFCSHTWERHHWLRNRQIFDRADEDAKVAQIISDSLRLVDASAALVASSSLLTYMNPFGNLSFVCAASSGVMTTSFSISLPPCDAWQSLPQVMKRMDWFGEKCLKEQSQYAFHTEMQLSILWKRPLGTGQNTL